MVSLERRIMDKLESIESRLDKVERLQKQVKAVAEIANQMDELYATNIQNLEGVRASLFHDYAKKLRASISQGEMKK